MQTPLLLMRRDALHGDLSCRTLWYREREGSFMNTACLVRYFASGWSCLAPSIGRNDCKGRGENGPSVSCRLHPIVPWNLSLEEREESMIASTQLIYLFTRHLTSGMLILLMFGILLNEMSARQSKYNTQIKVMSHQACRNVAKPSSRRFIWNYSFHVTL